MTNSVVARPWLLAFTALLAAGCGRPVGGVPSGVDSVDLTEAPEAEIGPYDSIELPLESVPEPPAEVIFHPEFQDPGSGAFVQVLRVLEDPRDIPLEWWLYFMSSGQGATLHPDAEAWRDRLEEEETSSLAVYVKVRAASNRRVRDPFSLSDDVNDDLSRIWSPLEVADPRSEQDLPCIPHRNAAGRETFTATDIDPGLDPQAYSPPLPWYTSEDQYLDPGEIREGWLLCLSAVPAEEVRLEWRARLEDAKVDEVTVAWANLHSMPVGEWHLLPDMTVVAWNMGDWEQLPESGPAPPPGFAATPTSVIPAEEARTVYQGPVWVSVGIGMSHRRGTTGNISRTPIISDNHGSVSPGDCPGVGVWYRHKDPFEVVCSATTDGRFGRFFLQFDFPGMKELLETWDRMALHERVTLELFMQSDLDGLLATFQGIQIQSKFTWLRADLPDDTLKVWLALTDVEGAGLVGPFPVWEVSLYDAAFDSTTTASICVDRSCLDIDELDMDPTDREALRLKMPIPIMDLGAAAHGITVRDAWTTDQTILVNDNLHGQDFLPQKRSKPWLFIEIATETDRAGDFYLLYPTVDGTYTVEPTELVALYQGSGGEIAVRYGVHAEVRGTEEGFTLLGTLPSGVSLNDVYLVLRNSGPAWRLR
jgi:hypothetical protein